MTLALGAKLGPYEILSLIGAGGMGEVYRAKDTRLDREVAIKVLPDRTTKDPAALSRFQREAKAVAALSHPNILAIYDVGNEHGVSYVVTELLEGGTLRERLRESELSWRKAVEIAIMVAEGMAAAHAKGIIHRDLKPENIFLTQDGRTKILDFGLARIEAKPDKPGQDTAHTPTVTIETRPGTIIGTLNYMSPEQLRGKQTDARSDIFSFGCVLYEMVTGKRAFHGETPADTMTAILREPAKSIRASKSDIGVELERVVDRCLEKQPEQRFHAASDLAFTLRTIIADSGPTPVAPPSQSTRWGRTIGIAGIVVAAVFAVFAAWMFRQSTNPSPAIAAAKIRALAVLPFENLSHDPDQVIFADSMSESITDGLAKISALKVTAYRTMKSYRDTTIALPEIARKLGRDAFVTGSRLEVGDRVEIRVQLVDAHSEQQLWSNHYVSDKEDILVMQQEIARAVAAEIKVHLTPSERELLATAPKVNPAAYRAYVTGVELVRRGTRESCMTGLEFFDDAIRRDSKFALAHAGRAEAYNMMGSTHMHPADTLPAMKQAAEEALDLDENLTDAHVVLGYYYMQQDWDWEQAGKSFQRAVDINPNDAKARLAKANYLIAMARIDEGMAQYAMAMELDPAIRTTEEFGGAPAFMSKRYEQVIRDQREALKNDPSFWPAHQWMGLAMGQLKQYQDAIYHLRTAADLSKSPMVRGMLGWAIALSGEQREARAIRTALKKLPNDMYVCPYEVATISIALDEYDEAFEDMHNACDDRAVCIPWLQVDPRLDPIRDDARFDELLERVGFEPPIRKLRIIETSDRKLPTLAVLPFKDRSPDHKEWFADGMTEELSATLAKIKALSVKSSTSTMRLKNSGDSLTKIARTLGADYIVEGDVLWANDRVRINVKLFDGLSETLLWSEQYRKSTSDLIELQNEVARDVAEQIQITLTPQERIQLSSGRSVDARAYEAYLQGRQYLRHKMKDTGQEALEWFDKAIEIDPGFAMAHVSKAESYISLVAHSRAPLVNMPKAKQAALKAIELDDSLAEAHAVLGKIQLRFDWDWDTAVSTLQRALELKPNLPEAHLTYAEYYAIMGDVDEANKHLNIAKETEPLSIAASEDYFFVYYVTRQYDQVVKYARQAVRMEPNSYMSRQWLGLALARQGKTEEAISEAEWAYALYANPITLASMGSVYAAVGLKDKAKEVLNKLEEIRRDRYTCAYRSAVIHAEIEETQEAIDMLGLACDDRSECMPFIKVDPRLDPIRGAAGFDELVECVGLEPEPLPLTLAESSSQGKVLTPREKIMLLVIPFDNLSGDPEQEYFSDGMTDEMITTLGRISPQELGVIARTSAMRYKNTDKAIAEIGRQLGVDYIVEGSVRRSGNTVRINAQLIQVADQTQLWGDSYTRDLSDVFAIQAEVARAVAKSLAMELLPHSQATQTKSPTTDSAAYDAYLKGRYHWNRRTGDSLRKSLTFFQEALRLDPAFALAYAGMAHAYVVLGGHHFIEPTESATKARAAATRALELDETLGEAHTVLAVTDTLFLWNWEVGLKHFERAIELNPNHPTAHQWYAETLVSLGRFDEGQREIEAAKRLDPLSPIITTSLGWFHYMAGEFDQAVRSLQQVTEFDDAFAFAHYALGEAYLEQGMFDEGVTAIERAVELASHGEFRANLGRAYVLAGQTERARQIVDELQADSKHSYQSPYLLARIFVAMGRIDAAFERLTQACDSRDSGLRHLLVDPAFKQLHGDPRFQELSLRIGLVPKIPVPQRGS